MNTGRVVITEKWRKWDYIDGLGIRTWLDRYGDVVKMEDKNGTSLPIFGLMGFKGTEFSAGYVYAPYITMETTVISEGFERSSGIMERYASKSINQQYYTTTILCGIDVARRVNDALSNVYFSVDTE